MDKAEREKKDKIVLWFVALAFAAARTAASNPPVMSGALTDARNFLALMRAEKLDIVALTSDV